MNYQMWMARINIAIEYYYHMKADRLFIYAFTLRWWRNSPVLIINSIWMAFAPMWIRFIFQSILLFSRSFFCYLFILTIETSLQTARHTSLKMLSVEYSNVTWVCVHMERSVICIRSMKQTMCEQIHWIRVENLWSHCVGAFSRQRYHFISIQILIASTNSSVCCASVSHSFAIQS